MAFQGFYNGVPILCLVTIAGLLPYTPQAASQSLELRGTFTAPVTGDGRAGRLSATETNTGGSIPYDPTSPGALPFDDDPGADPNDPFDGSEISADGLAEELSSPPALSDPLPGARSNLRTGPVADEEPRRMNQRVQPVQGSYLRRDDNPYAPVGFRIGTFNLFPTLEQGLSATSNASNSPGGEEALLSETRLQLRGNSDWSRHRLDFNGDLTHENAISGDVEPELRGSAQAMLRLDISHSLTGNARIAYDAERESVNSPLAVIGVNQQPTRHRLTGELGLEKGLGRLRFAANGRVTRERYGAAQLSDGTEISQADRNSTLTMASLRTGYELSPALMPFVEVEAGRRNHDETHDSAGYERSALLLGARAGIAVDFAEKLSGEVSAGWISENFDDARLRTLSGLALAASVRWSPMRGTNVFFDGSTTVEGGSGGDSGSLLYSSRLRLEHQLRSNLTGELGFGAAWRDYEAGGHDLTLQGEASLTWWLNRYAGLVTRVRHETRSSSDSAREYDSSSVFLGIRLQR